MSPKFAPRCGTRAIRKSKSLKTGMFGRLFEVQAARICTAMWGESGWEAKTVKPPGSRTTFWGSKCFSGVLMLCQAALPNEAATNAAPFSLHTEGLCWKAEMLKMNRRTCSTGHSCHTKQQLNSNTDRNISWHECLCRFRVEANLSFWNQLLHHTV